MTIVGTDSKEFEAAHRRLLADESLQFAMPQAKVEKPPAWLEPLLRFVGENSQALKYIFYASLAAGAAWLLWQAGRILYERWQERGGPEPAQEWRPEASVARRLLEEADALAGEGRYGEAAHLLLHRSIEDIDARRPDFVRPALTAREIAGAPSLPAAARAAFGTIAALVERSLFARRGLDANGWREARDAYARFAGEGQWA